MIKKLMILVIAFLLVVGLVTTGYAPKPTPKSTSMPDKFILGTLEVGTGGHKYTALVAEGIIEKYPDLTVRVVPAGSDTTRAYVIRLGEADTQVFTTGSAWFLSEGIYEFAEMTWGPQPVAYVWIARHLGIAFGTRGDSGIKKGEALKGRKVAKYPGSPGGTLINKSLLAFFDLTWDDVVPVDYATDAAAYQAVVDGKLDATFFNLASPKAFEGVALPVGWRWLEMSPDNKEGWARAQAVLPGHAPRVSTVGAGISKQNPLNAGTIGYPAIIAYDSADENTIYWITRAIHEAYDVYKSKDKSLEQDWTIDSHFQLWEAGIVPMHTGSIRYFKEIGMWTPEREKRNADNLQHQAKLKALFDAAKEEALAKGMKAKKFPAFWTKKRHATGFTP